MKPIEINRLSQAAPVRPELPPATQAKADIAGRAQAGAEPAMVSRSADALAGAEAPVDIERVEAIRSAIRDGNYPLIPTQMADAMIAASFLLTSPKED